MNGIIKENQYNFENFKNAVVADAGANIGLFSLYACARGAGRIYAFEPVRETYAILKSNIAANHLEKVVLAVNAALGAKQGAAKIKYCTRGEGSAMIAEGNAGVNVGLVYESERKVKVLALDDAIRRKVDLIKIDVEGYEGNVLLGAANLIRKHKPVLSFSAYHRLADKKTLPDIVRGLRKDYNITLNTFAEHDFYCD
ncbi:MAG: FkbM family methyltransferase [Elusimicrobiota bacterium]